MRYELVVIWSDGNKDIFLYNSREEAEQGARNMRMACGNQIQWTGVRKAVCG